MSKYTNPEFPVGSLFVDGSKTSRLIAMLHDVAVLRPTGADANDMQDFSMSVEEIREKMKRVDFEIKFSTAAYMESATTLHTQDVQFAELDDEMRDKALFGIACCMALEELRDEGVIKITEPSINANHDRVTLQAQNLYNKVAGVKKRGNRKQAGYVVPLGQTLMKQYNSCKISTFDPADFRTKHSKAGRPKKQFPQWVLDLMYEAMQPHLDGREPHVKPCYEMLKGKLLEVNAERARTVPGHVDIKVSERKFRDFADDLNPTAMDVARKGVEEMKRTMRSGFGEIVARMIGEVIQIDECQMPLWVFLEKTGLNKVVGEQTMRQLKSDAQNTKKGKVWILVAVDVATGMPLAFHLAKSPNADDTLELLRRLVSDKTKLAKEAGSVNPPPPAVRPYKIVMDTGSGLWNNVVPHAILSLGGGFQFGRTKSPSDKAFIERFFSTLGSDIMKALHGYNGQGPGTKTDYDGEDMTVMTIAQLEKYLWWYFTDCLPFKTTQRKGSWGGIRHVIFERMKKLYGMLSPLSHREVRRAVGLRVTRSVTKMGIEAFRMPFQGDGKFRAWALANIGAKVTVCVDPHRIEEATAITPTGEVHYLTACLSQFRHFSLSEWTHFLEEWRAADPLTEEVSVEALYRFYQRIRKEMDQLLEFYGKEHSVIKLADAQEMADSLVGGNLTILHGDVSGASAPRSALTASEAMGHGVFTPGGQVVEEAEKDETGGPVADLQDDRTEKKPVREPRKFTGKSKGKGGLK